MFETRVCISSDLLYAATQADRYEFNRRVMTELLAEEIDPQGISLLTCVVQYHRASFGPTPPGKPVWPDHHRCLIYCKVKGSDEPVRFYLDVEASLWDRLKTLDELKTMMDDPMEMAIASARANAAEEEEE